LWLVFSQAKQTTEVKLAGPLFLLNALNFFLDDKILSGLDFGDVGLKKTMAFKMRRHYSPRSPYGVSKFNAYWMTVNFRELTESLSSNGIFLIIDADSRQAIVTRKITRRRGQN
jgi:GDP-D-mannose dehydratase